MAIEKLRINTKAIGPSKVVCSAQFQVKTVLTLDPFNYVDLWLRRQHKDEALFYWRQSRHFYKASVGLPMESAPLVLYYCFMNAVKALLSAKGIVFSPFHGVKYHRLRGPNSKVILSNEGVEIKNTGIVPALSSYFGEAEPNNIHSLEEILYNLVFIHRTYCLSYPNRTERFLPLKNVCFVRNSDNNEVYFLAEAVGDADWKAARRRLPSEVEEVTGVTPTIQSRTKILWLSANKPTALELENLRDLNKDIRRSLHYINGAHTLWYLKLAGSSEIDRMPVTLTLSAMHRLSEICRYKPSELHSFLDGQKNWLLSEFVAMSPTQFLDEIACEMTGHQIMTPNVRAPM